jgi:hypothetical protein
MFVIKALMVIQMLGSDTLAGLIAGYRTLLGDRLTGRRV